MTDKVRVITEEQYKEYMLLKEKYETDRNADFPKDGEEYWLINTEGLLLQYTWENMEIDRLHKECCNVFKTEEEAQKELDRRIAEQELLDMVNAKMSDENYKWFIEYDPRGPVFYPNNTVFRFATPFLFSSKESCQKAINTLGDEKLKLIFRID